MFLCLLINLQHTLINPLKSAGNSLMAGDAPSATNPFAVKFFTTSLVMQITKGAFSFNNFKTCHIEILPFHFIRSTDFDLSPSFVKKFFSFTNLMR